MKYSQFILLSVFFYTFKVQTLISQQDGKRCGTTSAHEALYLKHPELIQKQIEYDKEISKIVKENKNYQKSIEPVYIIPIVFHVIHINGTENISDAQIYDAVDVLNRDYRLLNSDINQIIGNSPFDTLAADTRIEFRLAKIDPNGNCTNGIDRIYSHRCIGANDESKLNQWPRDKYMNIWVIKSFPDPLPGENPKAAYAYYPSAADGGAFPIDGLISLSDYIGTIGTSSPNTSRTITHEIGHYLNLAHPWGSTNKPEVSCGDDGVDDTPETMGHDDCNRLDDLNCMKSPKSTWLYTFDDVTKTSGTIDPTAVSTDSGFVTSTVFGRFSSWGSFSATGVSGNPDTTGRFSYSDWDLGGDTLDAASNVNADTLYPSLTGSINTSKYYEVTITPSYGSQITIKRINFNFQRNAKGVRTFSVRSSVDGFTNNLPATISPADSLLKVKTGNIFFVKYDTTSNLVGANITPAGTSHTNLISPVTFRFYGWNAEDTTGSFSIDNVSFVDTASVIENYQNYMDYSYCDIMFTKGQKDRMRAVLQSYVSGRNNLPTSTNLIATGTADTSSNQPCVPKPEFYANRRSVCAGGTITFTKNILNGTATNVVWTFPGGSPSTSTSLSNNVNVTYNTPGNYDVQLKASNSSGTDSVIKHFFVRVDPAWADFSGLVSENFEDNNRFFNYWSVNDMDNNENTWYVTSDAGYNSNQSVLMRAYRNYHFDVDDLVSPSFDLSLVNNATLTFRCAGASMASTTSDVNDALRIYYSINCGQSWVQFPPQQGGLIDGIKLINNGYNTGYFIPNNPNQWALHTANIPNNATTSNVRFKFEYETGSASNNIYIDDININGTLGIDENGINENSISIYPNPSNESSTIFYHLNEKMDIKIEIIDVLGKKVQEITNNNQGQGDYSIIVSKQDLNLKNGVYFIRFTANDGNIIKKLIFTE